MRTKPNRRRFKGLYRMPESKFWWFRWSVYGKRYARSLKTEDEAEATVRAQAILAEGLLAADSYAPKESTPRQREIHALVDNYLEEAQKRNKKPLRSVTADVHRYILRKFVVECGISRVGDITLGKISGWLQKLKSECKSPDTLWTCGQRVRSFIKFLVPKYLPPSILTNFTVPEASSNGRRNWVERDEVTRCLEATNEDMGLKFALLCGFDAGLRRNEISEAKVSWFDLNQGLLHITQHENFVPKDRDNRTIPLTDRFTFLQEYLAGRSRNEYVLAPGKTARGANKYRFDTNKRVRSHFKRCGIKATFHDMRRSFGSNRASAGVSIYKVAIWLGDGIEVVQKSSGISRHKMTRLTREFEGVVGGALPHAFSSTDRTQHLLNYDKFEPAFPGVLSDLNWREVVGQTKSAELDAVCDSFLCGGCLKDCRQNDGRDVEKRFHGPYCV